MLLLVPTGLVLDVLFGNSFFVFENHQAVSGWTFPAVGGQASEKPFRHAFMGIRVENEHSQ